MKPDSLFRWSRRKLRWGRLVAGVSIAGLSFLGGARWGEDLLGWGEPSSAAHPPAKVTAPPAEPPHRETIQPAEFEHQSALILGGRQLVRYHPRTFVRMVAALHRSVPLIALVSGEPERRAAGKLLRQVGLPAEAVRFVDLPLDTMWARDYGPLFERQSGGRARVLDFTYRPAAPLPQRPLDDDVPSALARRLHLPVAAVPLDLEGGNLLTNGEGLCVTSLSVIEANKQRGLDVAGIARLLKEHLGVHKWLCFRPLADEPTKHADLFVTFAAPDAAVVGRCDAASDPENAAILDEAADMLARQRTSRGPMRVYRIPMPPRVNGFWRTYTNVVFANGTLVVPTFLGVDPAVQREALALYARLLPGWKIVPIRADTLAAQRGSLRCVTRNVPAFVSVAPLEREAVARATAADEIIVPRFR